MIQNQNLSPHFELREFVASRTAKDHGIDNTPPEEAVENLRALCVHTLEPLRNALDLPIIVTSGYRCKALNHLLVNHSAKSQHMNGEAADFYVGWNGPEEDKPTRRELLIKAFRLILQEPEIDFDQLILYPTFIHVSFVSKEKNRRGILLARSDGKLGYGRITRANALRVE